MSLTVLFLAALSFAASPAKEDSSALSETLVAAQDTVVDTIYVIQESGIPWNREHFDPERLIRHDTFDPTPTLLALSAALLGLLHNKALWLISLTNSPQTFTCMPM